jgi:hypothetical protein
MSVFNISPISDALKKARENSAIWFQGYVNQRANKRLPHASCNTSAVCNAMYEANIPILWAKVGERPADTMMAYLQSPKGWAMLKEYYPKGKTANPWNYSEVLTDACNLLQGRQVASRRQITIQTLKELILNNTVVIGGTFAGLGHFICIHGYENGSFICDDSWGNALTRYKDHDGDDIRYSIDYIEKACFLNEPWKKGKQHAILFQKQSI